MDLKPYGPFEQAMQKIASKELLKPITVKYFWLGVGVTLGVVAITGLIVHSLISNKGKRKENE
jgi:hypothetical protein